MKQAGVAKRSFALQTVPMLRAFTAVPCLALLLASPSAALATSSDWFQAEGASVRLVTTGSPDGDGRLSGVVDVVLKPGWKTYWRDPGSSGVPPQIDISASTNIAGATLAFPPPEHHEDGSGTWAGYGRPVAFPVTFIVPSPGEPVKLDASLFIGVCQQICVPLQARFRLDPAADAANPDDRAVVEAAIAELPAEASQDFGVALVADEGERLVLRASLPVASESPELFLAGSGGYAFGTPKRVVRGGTVHFLVPVLERPATSPDGPGIDYTIVTESGSAAGIVPYP